MVFGWLWPFRAGARRYYATLLLHHHRPRHTCSLRAASSPASQFALPSRLHGSNPVPRTCRCHPEAPTAAGRGFSHKQVSQQRQQDGSAQGPRGQQQGAMRTAARCQNRLLWVMTREPSTRPPPASAAATTGRVRCKGPLGRTAAEARQACFGLQRGWPRSRAHRAQPVAAWPGPCHRRPDVQGPQDPPRAGSGVHRDQADALRRPAARGLAGALAQQACFLLAEVLLEAVDEARAGLLLRPRVNSTAGATYKARARLLRNKQDWIALLAVLISVSSSK